jgi:hypothetical protein
MLLAANSGGEHAKKKTAESHTGFNLKAASTALPGDNTVAGLIIKK